MYIIFLKNCGIIGRVIILALVITGCVCSSEKKIKPNVVDNILPVIKIRPPEQTKLEYLKLSQIANDIKYIPLETTKESMIGMTYKINELEKESFFIEYSGLIYQFSYSGKYVKKFVQKGKGPGEYWYGYYAVNSCSDEIIIYPGITKMLNKFNSDGILIDEDRNPDIFNNVDIVGLIPVGDKLGIINRTSKIGDTDLFIYDTQKKKVVDRLICNISNKTKSYRFQVRFNPGKYVESTFKGETYYKNLYSDTIYKCTDTGIEPFAIIDLGKHTFSDHSAKGDEAWKNSNALFYDKVIIENMCITENYIILYCRYNIDKPESYIAVIERETFSSKLYFPKIINDLNGGPAINLRMADGVALFTPDIYKTEEYIEYKKVLFPKEIQCVNPSRRNEFWNMIDTLDVNSNPIVQIIDFK